MAATQDTTNPPRRARGVLGWIEWAGNKLPDPALLFALLALIVVVVSAVGAALGWSVQPVKPELAPGAGGQLALVPAGEPISPRSLLSADGIYWMASSALRNFSHMPALPLIFVSMLGIGLAEKLGYFGALMRSLALTAPRRLLTPAIVFLGANSSVASDAGYIILPPLAAALFLAAGRHPAAGLAAAFCGVAGGFGGGLFPTGGDGVLTGFAQEAARVIDPGYTVDILHNYYFKIASAFVVTACGWFVTDAIVEPRLRRLHPDDAAPAGTDAAGAMALSPQERRGLRLALLGMGAVVAVFLVLVLVPGAPLHGAGKPTLPNGRVMATQAVTVLPADTPMAEGALVLSEEPLTVIAEGPPRLAETPGPRWSQVIVPLIFLLFLVPGAIYGRATGQLKSQADFVDAMAHGIRSIVPVLVILFFLAQFVGVMGYSGLDRMLAYAGGSALFEASLPVPLLVALFVLVVVFGDFAMSGMLSKFGVLAPIFIPMFMIVGMSPELTTATYRIGDSVVNIVTPLNSYLLIILAVFQKYRAGAGLGTLIALMLPYSLVLGLAWTLLLVGWSLTGIPLGPGAPLEFAPSG